MRILYLCNNRLGWQCLEVLTQRREQIVGLVMHPPARRKFGREILAAADLDESQIIDGSKLRDPATLDRIRELKPDIGISVCFGYILRRNFLELFPQGCVNLHTSLLPFNRGANPNVWSIADGTPAGVTLHYLDEGVDTGDVLAQQEVPVEPIDTGQTLYKKLEKAALLLFRGAWTRFCEGKITPMKQDDSAATCHTVNDLAAIDEIDLDGRYTARRLIDIIRARTFPPYAGAYFRHGGRKVYLRLDLMYEDELGNE